MNQEYAEIAGFISDEELENLVCNDAVGGATPTITVSSVPCVKGAIAVTGLVLTAISITLNAGACPTSACTKSC